MVPLVCHAYIQEADNLINKGERFVKEDIHAEKMVDGQAFVKKHEDEDVDMEFAYGTGDNGAIGVGGGIDCCCCAVMVMASRSAQVVLAALGKAKVGEEEVSLPKDKGKGKEKKEEEVDAMPIKRARQEETTDSEANTRRKTKDSTKSSKKKKTKPCQKLTIKDFALGESSQPYDLVDDVSMQSRKIFWPQILYLPPEVCRQWSKMMSTRRVNTKAMGLVAGRSLKDIVSVVDAYVKGGLPQVTCEAVLAQAYWAELKLTDQLLHPERLCLAVEFSACKPMGALKCEVRQEKVLGRLGNVASMGITYDYDPLSPQEAPKVTLQGKVCASSLRDLPSTVLHATLISAMRVTSLFNQASLWDIVNTSAPQPAPNAGDLADWKAKDLQSQSELMLHLGDRQVQMEQIDAATHMRNRDSFKLERFLACLHPKIREKIELANVKSYANAIYLAKVKSKKAKNKLEMGLLKPTDYGLVLATLVQPIMKPHAASNIQGVILPWVSYYDPFVPMVPLVCHAYIQEPDNLINKGERFVKEDIHAEKMVDGQAFVEKHEDVDMESAYGEKDLDSSFWESCNGWTCRRMSPNPHIGKPAHVMCKWMKVMCTTKGLGIKRMSLSSSLGGVF
ncbi:hypothetical protein L7F22_054367 [Adiantum nelumboides]|nr:hypothetical protein [Adiantum nelumboides]